MVAKRAHTGYSGYASILAALKATPGVTTKQLGEALGLSQQCSILRLNQMRSMRLVRREKVVEGRFRTFAWFRGEDSDVSNEVGLVTAAGRFLVSFALGVRALQKQGSVAEVASYMGVAKPTARALIDKLRAAGLVRIGGWRRRHGIPTALYTYDDQVGDCKRLARKSRAKINTQFRARAKKKKEALVREEAARIARGIAMEEARARRAARDESRAAWHAARALSEHERSKRRAEQRRLQREAETTKRATKRAQDRAAIDDSRLRASRAALAAEIKEYILASAAERWRHSSIFRLASSMGAP